MPTPEKELSTALRRAGLWPHSYRISPSGPDGMFAVAAILTPDSQRLVIARTAKLTAAGMTVRILRFRVCAHAAAVTVYTHAPRVSPTGALPVDGSCGLCRTTSAELPLRVDYQEVLSNGVPIRWRVLPQGRPEMVAHQVDDIWQLTPASAADHDPGEVSYAPMTGADRLDVSAMITRRWPTCTPVLLAPLVLPSP